jgi:hypothetical protein
MDGGGLTAAAASGDGKTEKMKNATVTSVYL